jgi:hypothetical protein
LCGSSFASLYFLVQGARVCARVGTCENGEVDKAIFPLRGGKPFHVLIEREAVVAEVVLDLPQDRHGFEDDRVSDEVMIDVNVMKNMLARDGLAKDLKCR